MSKKKRVRKIVKGHLNRIEKNGTPLYADDAAKVAALVSLNLLADGVGRQAPDGKLMDVLGISNPGSLTESIKIDADNVVHSLDSKPFDARHGIDTDKDGLSDNQEIVTLFSTIESQQVIMLGHETAATTQLSIATSALAAGDLVDGDAGVAADETAFNAEESKLLVALAALGSIETQGSVEKSTMDANVALITTLPVPETGITLEGEDPNSIHQTEAASVQTLALSAQTALDSKETLGQDRKTSYDALNDTF
jgi:hypothetical protein